MATMRGGAVRIAARPNLMAKRESPARLDGVAGVPGPVIGVPARELLDTEDGVRRAPRLRRPFVILPATDEGVPKVEDVVLVVANDDRRFGVETEPDVLTTERDNEETDFGWGTIGL
jgi:hypothetical protein